MKMSNGWRSTDGRPATSLPAADAMIRANHGGSSAAAYGRAVSTPWVTRSQQMTPAVQRQPVRAEPSAIRGRQPARKQQPTATPSRNSVNRNVGLTKNNQSAWRDAHPSGPDNV